MINKYLNAAQANPHSVPWRLFNLARRRFPLDQWLFDGWSFPPDIVTILVTKKCNFGCVGCSSSSPQYTKEFRGQEMSTETIKKFIDEVAWFKPGIYFNGGETMLRRDLFELIRYAKSKGLVTAFTTNGSLLTEKNVEGILASGLDFLSSSLDGRPEHHNKWRVFATAYERLTEGIALLIKKRRELGLKTPHVRISCIINPEDKDDALFVLDKTAELGADEVAFGNYMFYPEDYADKQKYVMEKFGTGGPHMIGLPVKGRTLPFKVDWEGLRGLYGQLKIRAAKARLPLTIVPPKIKYEAFYSFENPSEHSRCLSPYLIATLLPDGQLTSCQEYLLGDVTKNSFMSLWNGEKMKKFRRYRNKNVFPACFRCLEGQELEFDH